MRIIEKTHLNIMTQLDKDRKLGHTKHMGKETQQTVHEGATTRAQKRTPKFSLVLVPEVIFQLIPSLGFSKNSKFFNKEFYAM